MSSAHEKCSFSLIKILNKLRMELKIRLRVGVGDWRRNKKANN